MKPCSDHETGEKSHQTAFLLLVRYDCTTYSYGIRERIMGKRMKLPRLNKYSTAAMLFLAAAVVFVALALVTNLGEFITAAYVISGAILAMTGIFLLTFSLGEPVDPLLIGLLPVQGCSNLCRIATDLGIHGKAYFLPPRINGEARVMQFNPTHTYSGSLISAKGSFPETGPAGLVTIPFSDPFIQVLKKNNALVIPDKEEKISQLLREILGDILAFAERVSVSWQGATVTITLHGFRSPDGCTTIARDSPECCARFPCTACSLCGAVIAEGKDAVVTLNRCSVGPDPRTVTAVFVLVPQPD